MKEIIDQYAPILEGIETKELKTKIKTKQKQLRLNGKSKTECIILKVVKNHFLDQ